MLDSLEEIQCLSDSSEQDRDFLELVFQDTRLCSLLNVSTVHPCRSLAYCVWCTDAELGTRAWQVCRHA